MAHASQAQLRQWFDAIDVRRKGELDVVSVSRTLTKLLCSYHVFSQDDLQRALARGNLNFSLLTVAHMIRFVDARSV